MLQIDLSELERTVDDLQHDVRLVKDLSRDAYFLDLAKDAINKNFEDIWKSKGVAINENWNGRTLVKTGNLRNSLTTNRIQLRVAGDILYFESTVYYAGFVNELYQFYGITPETSKKLTEAVGTILKRRGKLNWTVNR